MGTAAQFRGKVSHGNHPHGFSVFLAEKRHCAGLFRFFKAHHLCLHAHGFGNLLVDNFFNPVNFLRRHGGKMAEVKTQPVPVYKGAFLLHMRPQHSAQRFLEKMGGAVVLTGIASVFFVHLKRHLIARFQHPLYHTADMAHLAAKEFNGLLHLKFPVRAGNDSVVPVLAAHGSVKRRFFHDNSACFPVGQSVHKLRLRGKHGNFRIVNQMAVSHKFRGDGRVNGLVNGHVRSHVIGDLAGSPCHVLLLLHGRLKAFLVHADSFFLQNLHGKVKRKSISVIQPKRVLAGKGLFPLFNHGFFHIV